MKWATPKNCVVESTGRSNRQPDEFLYGDFNARMAVNDGGIMILPAMEVDEDVLEAERILADKSDRIIRFKPSR